MCSHNFLCPLKTASSFAAPRLFSTQTVGNSETERPSLDGPIIFGSLFGVVGVFIAGAILYLRSVRHELYSFPNSCTECPLLSQLSRHSVTCQMHHAIIAVEGTSSSRTETRGHLKCWELLVPGAQTTEQSRQSDTPRQPSQSGSLCGIQQRR